MSEPAQFELIRKLFATFDSKDAATLAGFVTGDVRLRRGNAPLTTGKPAFIDAYGAFVTSVAGVWHEILNLWRDGNIVIAQLDMITSVSMAARSRFRVATSFSCAKAWYRNTAATWTPARVYATTT